MNTCITGVSRGLGKALCKEFVRQGHYVWGIARSGEELNNLNIEAGNNHLRTSCIDVADIGSIASWVMEMKEQAFVPDMVILNASIQRQDMLDGYDHGAGWDVLRTNLDGTMQCVEAFLPDFLERGAGRFVAITSTCAQRPSSRSASYCASKAGVELAFRSLQLRFSPEGVEFARVTMGPIASAMWKGKKGIFIPSPEQAAKSIARFAKSHRIHLYYPFFSTLFLRATYPLSDRVFVWLSNKLAG